MPPGAGGPRGAGAGTLRTVLALAWAAALSATPSTASGARVPWNGIVWDQDQPGSDGSVEMLCTLEERDGRGAVTKTLVLAHRLTFRVGQRTREDLLWAREDGRDVTGRERSKTPPEPGGPRRWTVDEALSPGLSFLVRSAGDFRFREEPAQDGVRRLVYEPSPAAAGRAARGVIEMDDEGRPVRHRFEPAPLPRLVSVLATETRYVRLGDRIVPVETETVGEGGFLFIRKRFRARMTYRNWSFEP